MKETVKPEDQSIVSAVKDNSSFRNAKKKKKAVKSGGKAILKFRIRFSQLP